VKKQSRINNRKASLTLRRELRSNLTFAEALLWINLKNSKLDGKKFRRQHGIGPYIADFYCPECRVIVELDGAGHYGVLGQEKDAERTRFLENLGLRVIRFENCEVLKNLEAVLETIRAVLRENVS
jgi:very-short-patch-repair endonuclease